MRNIKIAFLLKNKISSVKTKNKRKYKKCFVIQFGDIIFYQFLNKIGLKSAKSKTIKKAKVPNKFLLIFYADYLMVMTLFIHIGTKDGLIVSSFKYLSLLQA